MKKMLMLVVLFVVNPILLADQYERLDLNSLLKDYKALKTPEPNELLLQKGDRLAICGDSITEQKMYSRIVETYLTVCVPELDITVRQYGWGGETAPGFLGRMKNDCLRFNPTIATTCYGMNDFHYLPYKEEYGKEYRDSTTAIIDLFKKNGTRVILGSPGCVGKKPWWQEDPAITTNDLNLSLLKFRNIDVEIASEQDTAFADIYVPMLMSVYKAQTLYGSDFKVCGDDGVHPDWAGHVIMAYAFLKSMGLDGQIGTVTVDLSGGKATATEGHQVLSTSGANSSSGTDGKTAEQSVFAMTIESRRYPYCAQGEPDKFNSARAGMNLVPFNETLNRFDLVVKNTPAKKYKVTWGDWEKSYSSEQLNAGVNLAADFALNPFSEPFNAVSEAIKVKQEYETKQIKSLFHGDEGMADMEATVQLTEKAHQRLADDIVRKFKPVRHTIKIAAE